MKGMGKIVILIILIGSIVALINPMGARNNSTTSATMIFQGNLTDQGNGVFTGTIPMVDEAALSIGDHESGFDVFARNGAEAYCQGYYGTGAWNGPGGTDTFIIGYFGELNDAYPSQTGGGPWGSWYDPDCADWDKYSLQLTTTHWYLKYTPTGESPMSGSMSWTTLYASETDLGTQAGGHDGSAAHGGGSRAWDWDCGWGVEVIPLAHPGFRVAITQLGGGVCRVTLTPAPRPIIYSEKAPTFGKQLCPLSRYNINQAEELSVTVQDLLNQAQTLDVDTSDVEELISEAHELLEKAKAFCEHSQNCIAGNILAIEAQKLLLQAKELLESMLS
jgi:hypothetical protein